jgi:hypothetical protein
MKEKINRFIIIGLVAFFSPSMACADTAEKVNYPYIERVEIGFKPQEFALDSTARKQTVRTEKKVDEEETDWNFGKDVAIAVMFLLAFIMFCFLGLVIILGGLGFISLLITKLFHKKR